MKEVLNLSGQVFSQVLNQDDDGVRTAAIAQTREGVDEWINPIAFWEKDTNSGLYLPPGVGDDADIAKPRFRGPELEDLLDDLKDVLEAIKDTAGVKKIVDALKLDAGDDDLFGENKPGYMKQVGRNVLLASNSSRNITITAGASFDIIGESDVNDYTEIRISFRWELPAPSSTFRGISLVNQAQVGREATEHTNVFIHEIFYPKSDKFKISVFNNETTDHDVYGFSVLGVN